MKRKLVEYKIMVPSELKRIKLLWRKFLKDDPYWHFALEGDYFELRTSGVNRKLETYLKKKKWEYTKRDYKNNTRITRKYQSCFDDIYHGYAMLAMTLPKAKLGGYTKDQDVYRVLERCIHLAFNNIGWGLGLGSERHILWLILADRTYMAGHNHCRMTMELETKKEIKKKKKGS